MSVAAPAPTTPVRMADDPCAESVWDYPRPPALQPCGRRVRIELGGVTIADSTAALRVLETSHPPTIYVPPRGHRARVYQPGRRALLL